jgi:acetyl esterase/lipase
MGESQENAKNWKWKFVFSLYELLRPVVDFFPVLFMLFFFGALFWAKWQDPFSRHWFTLKTADYGSFKCVAVFPKSQGRHPIIIYTHGSGGSLMNDGYELRQMAELGLVTVSVEYNQSNEVAFNSQFQSLLDYVGHQKWADTNAIAWVGFSQGANWMLDFALQHPNQQPQLLVQISGAGVSEVAEVPPLTLNPSPLGGARELQKQDFSRAGGGNVAKFPCQVLLVHSDQDEIFPLADTKQFANILQSNGVPVELKIIPGLPRGMEPERGVVFRSVGEYCLTHLVGKNALQKYHSIAQWEAEAPRFWLFCLSAVGWVIGWNVWKRRHRQPLEKIKLNRYEIILRWVAAILATWALTETAFRLVSPHCLVSERTLSVARRILVQPKQRADFETLACQPIWKKEKLKTLLDQVELAGYNRELINWQLDPTNYDNYVLSPVITGTPGERFDWRRPLWEEFYPRIRHESSPDDAARIVVRHLRERVTIAAIPDPPRDIPTIWLRQLTDETGFQIICVGALRSVGVPARLNSNRQAEFWDDLKWSAAPSPAVITW